MLVVTPQVSFGELIRQSLNDSGSYDVHIVRKSEDAAQVAETKKCFMALMDMELGEQLILSAGIQLRAKNPDIHLVIMADDELPPAMDEIRPWVLLRKPFYLPDFLQLIQAAPPTSGESFEPPEEGGMDGPRNAYGERTDVIEPAWLNDVSKAAQHLTRLTLESSAQAALITRQEGLWAYAGGLPQDSANELAQIVSRLWDAQKGNDLLRFVRLDSTKAEHMLYATQMTPGVILALAFDAETPFSTIRSQASSLAQSLSIPNTGPLALTSSEPAPVLPADRLEASNDQEIDEGFYPEEAYDIPSISDILNEIPPPIPSVSERESVHEDSGVAAEGTRISTEERRIDVTRPSPASPKPLASPDRLRAPAVSIRELMTEEPVSPGEREQELATTMPSNPLEGRPTAPLRQPDPGELEQTRPHPPAERTGRMIVEAASAAMAQLNYACLLIPRLTTHYMTGDVADHLSVWIPEMCLAFGWRLEYLAVRPEYLQWVVNVMPNTSPGYVMRVMRLQTSERIFEEFPRLKRENPSGDFWAPGYLILSSLQPHPPQLVKDYIQQIRRRQGITQSHH